VRFDEVRLQQAAAHQKRSGRLQGRFTMLLLCQMVWNFVPGFQNPIYRREEQGGRHNAGWWHMHTTHLGPSKGDMHPLAQAEI